MRFLPAITDGVVSCTDKRRLMALPPNFGGLGKPLFGDMEYQIWNIKLLTKTLHEKIILQDSRYDTWSRDKEEQKQNCQN